MERVDAAGDRERHLLHPPHPDGVIRELSARFEVFTRAQLIAAGLTARQVRLRAATGRLRVLPDGVFSASHAPPSRTGRWRAAVLAAGPGARLSHLSAGALWEITRIDPTVVDVTVPQRGRRPLDGIRVHQARRLDPRDLAVRHGVPTTRPARILLDLAEVTDDRRLVERAWDEAEFRHRLRLAHVLDALERADGRRGAKLLRAIAADRRPSARTQNDFEEMLLALVDAAGLPRPRAQAPIRLAGRTIHPDFAWPEQRLVVETDGLEAHGTRRALQEDRSRDRELLLLGWRVVRFTWQDLERRSGHVTAVLTTLLEARIAA